ncbi:EamA/RhaT family transporter [Olivibacter sp. XZL3]|uniref:EamA family transporter n=1 Tax=Olivibacter sp. XZL3 TaxID=1735116 RepID=UPI001F0E167F|nr:EamA/RhaT family transporter [Olivibacter sp. XZL3]
MIAWNYPVAVLLSYHYLEPDLNHFSFAEAPLATYLILGLLLPSLFVIIAGSIRYSGIVRTEVAQRLSLFIPLLAAFFIFNEHPSVTKLVGVAVGLVAIACSIKWQKRTEHTLGSKNAWRYPLMVFFGMGIIDILFKHIAQYQAVSYKTSIFLVFVLCVLVSFLYIGFLAISKREKFSLSGTLWGLALGLFNFGNILFYMKAHQALPNNPSIVFSGMNIGVIVVGAIVGLFLFKEKLSTLNKVGLLLAVISVVIIGTL